MFIEKMFSSEFDKSMTVEDIIATCELDRRPVRPADYRTENQLLRIVVAHLGKPSQKLLDRLVGCAKTLCRAGSAGLSLIAKDSRGSDVFRWVAMAGAYRKFVGGTTPRTASALSWAVLGTLEAGEYSANWRQP